MASALAVRERKAEGRSLPQGGCDPDAPAVAGNDLFPQRQANASAGILMSGVQTLKEDKNTIEIFRIDPHAVIYFRELLLTLPCLLITTGETGRKRILKW